MPGASISLLLAVEEAEDHGTPARGEGQVDLRHALVAVGYDDAAAGLDAAVGDERGALRIDVGRQFAHEVEIGRVQQDLRRAHLDRHAGDRLADEAHQIGVRARYLAADDAAGDFERERGDGFLDRALQHGDRRVEPAEDAVEPLDLLDEALLERLYRLQPGGVALFAALGEAALDRLCIGRLGPLGGGAGQSVEVRGGRGLGLRRRSRLRRRTRPLAAVEERELPPADGGFGEFERCVHKTSRSGSERSCARAARTRATTSWSTAITTQAPTKSASSREPSTTAWLQAGPGSSAAPPC